MDDVRVVIDPDGFPLSGLHAPDPACVGCAGFFVDHVRAWFDFGPEGPSDRAEAAFRAFYAEVALTAHSAPTADDPAGGH